MAKVSATASMGVKLKQFSDFENVNPHASISVERELPNDLSDEQLIDQAKILYKQCRKYVETEIGKDVESAKGKQK